MKAWVSLNFGQIPPLTPEVSALMRLKKMMYIVLNTLAPSFLIGCSSFFGTRTLVHNIHDIVLSCQREIRFVKGLISVSLRNILAIAIRVETNGMCNNTRTSSLGLVIGK